MSTIYYEDHPKVRKLIVCDIDGVLADNSHRQHFLQKEPKDWETFFNTYEVSKDKLILPVLDILVMYENSCFDNPEEIVLVTGRMEKLRDVTERWLEFGTVPYHRLIMRPDDNFEQDAVFKKKVLDTLGPENITFWIEDSKRVVDMLRAEGVFCLQTAETY